MKLFKFIPSNEVTYRLKATLFTIVFLILFIAAVRSANSASLPDDILNCWNISGPWVQQNETLVENGMIESRYGHTEDSPITLVTYSIPNSIDRQLENDPSDSFPLFYILYLTSELDYAIILLDREQQGKCEDFELFLDEGIKKDVIYNEGSSMWR